MAWRVGATTISALALTAAAPLPSTSDHHNGVVTVSFEGLRSHKGMLRACLTSNPKFFPHCDKDPKAHKASVAATGDTLMRFADVAPGAYALTVLHDENGNFRADMMLGIPREGVGFSRNPVLRMKPPSFDMARFAVPAAEVQQDVKIKYFL